MILEADCYNYIYVLGKSEWHLCMLLLFPATHSGPAEDVKYADG